MWHSYPVSSKIPNKLSSSEKLVFVHSILTEEYAGAGAILIMKDGSFRMIIKSGSVNFEMKDPMEKQALAYNFGAMCDSLEIDFPIQIVSHSKLINSTTYTDQFQDRLKNQNTPEQVRRLIASHLNHFENQIEDSKLMQREIFVVIPYKGVEPPKKDSALDDIPFSSLFKSVRDEKTQDEIPMDQKPDDLEISLAKQNLDVRSGQIMSRLGAMGISAQRLDSEAIRVLLYGFFHPGLSDRQKSPGVGTDGNLVSGFSTNVSRTFNDEAPRF